MIRHRPARTSALQQAEALHRVEVKGLWRIRRDRRLEPLGFAVGLFAGFPIAILRFRLIVWLVRAA